MQIILAPYVSNSLSTRQIQELHDIDKMGTKTILQQIQAIFPGFNKLVTKLIIVIHISFRKLSMFAFSIEKPLFS